MKSHSALAYRRNIFILMAVAAICVAVVLGVRNSYYLNLLTYSAIYSIAALGLFLLFGYAGQISLAQGAFFGIGAYTTSYLTMKLGVPSALSLVFAGVIPGIVGWLVAQRLLKLTNNYLAMATLAFGSICIILFGQARSITGGLDPGMIGVPPFMLFGYQMRSPSATFGLCATVLLVATFLTINLVHSRIGRSLRALRSSEVAADGLGIEVVRYKVIIFAIAAGMTGVAGALFAHVQQSFNASSFSVGLSLELLLMVVIGSVFTPWGAIIGALFITILPHMLEGFEHFKLLVYGVMMTIVMIFMPDGLGKGIVDGLSSALRPAEAKMTLVISGLTKRYGGLVAVSGVSFEAAPRQITSVIGPNGAGKTTLLNLVSGTVIPDSGSVRLFDTDITNAAPNLRARKGLARTYQTPQLFDDMTVLDTVKVGAHQTGACGFVTAMLRTEAVRREEADMDTRARAALDRVGLPQSLFERESLELAYGLQRRVEIARALAMQPKALLLDEPAAGLNARETEEISVLFRALADEGLIVVLVEHDMSMVMSISDKVVVMNFGTKIAEGSTAQVQTDPAVIDAYLGAPNSKRSMLELNDIRVRYGAIEALAGVSLTVEAGEIVCLIGANGAGKSTVLNAISGVVPLDSGSSTFEGAPLSTLGSTQIVRKGVVQVPEGRLVFPDLTVLENLEMGGYTQPSAGFQASLDAVFALFPRLADRRQQLAGLMSGGEQQMLAIGRALTAKPKLLLLDEPSMGLAPLVIVDIFQSLRRLRTELGLTILLVEQNARAALSLSDRGYVLVNGRIAKTGKAADLAADPAIREAFLGSAPEPRIHSPAQ